VSSPGRKDWVIAILRFTVLISRDRGLKTFIFLGSTYVGFSTREACRDLEENVVNRGEWASYFLVHSAHKWCNPLL
jgi:hypothetical protein